MPQLPHVILSVKTDSYDLSMELLPQRDELKYVSTTHGGLCATTFGTIGPPVWSAINLAYHRQLERPIRGRDMDRDRDLFIWMILSALEMKSRC
ncbi:hypothetical protein GBAR_LOCUS2281 [Geodia barretti]|uniref:Uncharacterized protein n=1 Tax=Geodia barretti TaxID=519541 RepID=A0AA35R025_GEOBA|nr:hypothetical protein GBAR_LOCUS2281 [Geodia barretti]